MNGLSWQKGFFRSGFIGDLKWREDHIDSGFSKMFCSQPFCTWKLFTNLWTCLLGSFMIEKLKVGRPTLTVCVAGVGGRHSLGWSLGVTTKGKASWPQHSMLLHPECGFSWCFPLYWQDFPIEQTTPSHHQPQTSPSILDLLLPVILLQQ